MLWIRRFHTLSDAITLLDTLCHLFEELFGDDIFTGFARETKSPHDRYTRGEEEGEHTCDSDHEVVFEELTDDRSLEEKLIFGSCSLVARKPYLEGDDAADQKEEYDPKPLSDDIGDDDE